MPGDIERVVGLPSSFYGSHKSTNGYCTRQNIGQQKTGLKSGLNAGSSKLMWYGQMDGGKLRRNQLAFGSSNKIPVSVHQNSAVLAPRHCRYFNMQVRRLPRKQSALNLSAVVNGSSLPQTSSPAARRAAAAEMTLARSRESRVFISAELKHKADNEMKNVLVSVDKSVTDSCSNGGGSGQKKVEKTDEAKTTDGTVLAKLYDKGLKLRNGRSLPDCIVVKQEKLVTCNAGQQSGNDRFDVRAKKCRMQYRSCSLSPAKPSVLARPRRSVFTKKSVSCVFVISTPHMHYVQHAVYNTSLAKQ